YAALWNLTESLDPPELERRSKEIAYASGADKSGWDAVQVLRVPGTRNFKYATRPTVRQLWFRDTSFSPDKFIGLGRSGGDVSGILKKRKIPRKVLTVLQAKRPTQGKRSEVLWRLYHDLMDAGCTDAEIEVLIAAS